MAPTVWLYVLMGVALFYLWLNPDKVRNAGALRLSFICYLAAMFSVPLFTIFRSASVGSQDSMDQSEIWATGAFWTVAAVSFLFLFKALEAEAPAESGAEAETDEAAGRGARRRSERKGLRRRKKDESGAPDGEKPSEEEGPAADGEEPTLSLDDDEEDSEAP